LDAKRIAMSTAIVKHATVVAARRERGAALTGRLTEALAQVALWRDRLRGRRQLARMDQRGLSDIGITRADVFQETRKWFWEA
jgi:uncharacterized protein YjiS (DUF1127 family)